MEIMKTDLEALKEILSTFEIRSGLSGVNHEYIKTNKKTALVIYVAHPTELHFAALEDARHAFLSEGADEPIATIKKKHGEETLDGPEGRLLLKTLAESQNINRYSFGNDFMSRYTRSVSGAESQVVSNANHVVLGRRGAGKSTLLLFALHDRKKNNQPCVWVDMQVYSRRDDLQIAADVFREIFDQIFTQIAPSREYNGMISALSDPNITDEGIRRILPSVRRELSYFSKNDMNLFIFLDDFHVVSKDIQPLILDYIYACARGNRIFLKISAIETLTQTYDQSKRIGLEIPQDAQYIRLDYNLTSPDRATAHIEAIIDSHAKYAGIRSARSLCTSADVLPRLTWVAAGVPRDAINLFAQAMTKASVEGRKKVSVSNINVAASETISTKLRDLDQDASEESTDLRKILDAIREFCVTEKRKNAFLIEISNKNEKFELIQNLVNLRLLHVITEGITVGDAGRKFMGLILDYGFYTGIRAAQSVDLFNKQSKKLTYKDLRGLPIFK